MDLRKEKMLRVGPVVRADGQHPEVAESYRIRLDDTPFGIVPPTKEHDWVLVDGATGGTVLEKGTFEEMAASIADEPAHILETRTVMASTPQASEQARIVEQMSTWKSAGDEPPIRASVTQPILGKAATVLAPDYDYEVVGDICWYLAQNTELQETPLPEGLEERVHEQVPPPALVMTGGFVMQVDRRLAALYVAHSMTDMPLPQFAAFEIATGVPLAAGADCEEVIRQACVRVMDVDDAAQRDKSIMERPRVAAYRRSVTEMFEDGIRQTPADYFKRADLKLTGRDMLTMQSALFAVQKRREEEKLDDTDWDQMDWDIDGLEELDGPEDEA